MRVLALFALLAACNGAEDPSGPFTVLTYNAGLATGFVPAAEDRTPKVAAAAVAEDADVVCLQEVWTPDQVAAFEAAAADVYPHTFFPAPQQETSATPACAEGELDALLACVETNCGDACEDDLVDCMFASCALPFLGLSKDCNRCTQANVGSDPADIRDACESGAVEYAYGGSFGTGILSKHPLGDVEEIVFASTTNRRSVLRTTVDLPGASEVELLCTHLTAVFALIPYPRDEGSWAAEQRVQVERLVELVNGSDAELLVLAGDLNAGPPVGEVEGEQADHYALLAATELRNPYVRDGGPCTFCGDNELLEDATPDRVIDHVLVRGAGASSARRVLDEAITALSCDRTIPAHPSDHYGVLAEITP